MTGHANETPPDKGGLEKTDIPDPGKLTFVVEHQGLQVEVVGAGWFEALYQREQELREALETGWREKNLPEKTEWGGEWTDLERISYLLYLSDPSVAVEVRTQELRALAEGMARAIEEFGESGRFENARRAFTAFRSVYPANETEGT